jgi:hypothetical protein
MNYSVPIHGSRIGEEIEMQIPHVRFQPQLQQVDEVSMNIPVPRVEEPPRMRIRDRIRDPSAFRLCDDKECVDVHISPLRRIIQENYTTPSTSSSTSIIVWITVAILFLVVVYMAFNNIYPFRFFENLMF